MLIELTLPCFPLMSLHGSQAACRISGSDLPRHESRGPSRGDLPRRERSGIVPGQLERGKHQDRLAGAWLFFDVQPFSSGPRDTERPPRGGDGMADWLLLLA